MSMIEHRLKEIRDMASVLRDEKRYAAEEIMCQAADTIEALSAKLAAANEELERWHTDKINEKIKNPFVRTSTLCCHNCDHKDEYIEELEAANMERSDRYYGGGWIPCEDRLPEESGEYNVTDENGKSTTLYYDKKQNAWVDIGEMAMLGHPIAWQPLPEPYRPQPQRS